MKQLTSTAMAATLLALAAPAAWAAGGHDSAGQAGQPAITGQPGAFGTTSPGAPDAAGSQASGSAGAALGGSGRMDAQQVRDMLRQEGYTDIEVVRRDGDRFHATARKDGQNVTLEVNPGTGRVERR